MLRDVQQKSYVFLHSLVFYQYENTCINILL
jgi:hypothetical protein